MSNVGSWNINVNKNMPQKIASAVTAMNERFGVEVTPIAYIGSQLVNGTLHAVLIENKIVLGEDQVNVNLVKFLETKDGVAEISNDIIVEGGMPIGGIKVDPKFGDDIPEVAMEVFNRSFAGFVGSNVKPIALISSQMVKGTNYTFLCEVATVTAEPKKAAFLVTVNEFEQRPGWVNVLATKEELAKNGTLGYAFTW